MQTVHLIDTLSHTVSGLFAEVPGLKKPKVVGIAADITTAECADKIAKALEKHFQGHVDILVNNAALIKSVKLGEMDAEVVQAMLFANVQTPLMIVNELVKKKMFRKDSRIVNISSDSAHNNPFRPGRYVETRSDENISRSSLTTHTAVGPYTPPSSQPSRGSRALGQMN